METSDFYTLLAQVAARLRRRLLILAGLLGLATCIGYFFADDVMRCMFKMVRQVIFISPTEAFVTKLKVSFAIGLTVSLPAFIYLVIGVLKGRVRDFSRRSHVLLTLAGFGLFVIGAAFCYFAVLPVGINFLLDFATLEMQPLLSAGRFVSFVLTCMMAFGLMFEMPLVIMLLASLGLLTADTLRSKRRHAVVLIFIIAGAFTPSPDVISQILLAIPMLGLYESGIILSRVCRQREEKLPEMPADQQQIFN
jgi:sec-independent protein translocase protein TatC